jgi:CBS domain-containing membrane protein
VDQDADEGGRSSDAHRGVLVAEEYHGLHGKLVDCLDMKGNALYTFVACLLALGMSGLAAYVFKQPLLFPSLGPTAFLFFEQPLAKPSSPRNTLIGHFVAILVGALSLAVFGLLDHPSILTEGVTLARVGAGALSVALTGAVLLLLRSSHPPSGATVLIVSLGLLQTPWEMVMLMLGVVLLTVLSWAINRALGVPMPVWIADG